jgi:hypothetical protein
MSTVNETFRALENAIDAHIKNTNEEGIFPTGWLIVSSVSSPEHDIGATDGYITYTSDGLPHHAQIGLLTLALDDKKNMGILSTLAQQIALGFDEEEWDEEENQYVAVSRCRR